MAEENDREVLELKLAELNDELKETQAKVLVLERREREFYQEIRRAARVARVAARVARVMQLDLLLFEPKTK